MSKKITETDAENKSDAPIRRVYHCARECMPLMALGREILFNEGISKHPNAFGVLEFSMQRLGSVQDQRVINDKKCIDFLKLHTLPASHFGVPEQFCVMGSRYSLTVDAPEFFFQKLALLTAQLTKSDFPGVKRTVYANLTIRILLRFLVADNGDFCPFREWRESDYRLYPLTFQLKLCQQN